MKNRRQSPMAAHSLILRPNRSELVNSSSLFFRSAALARSTSSSVTGSVRTPSTVSVMSWAASSRERPSRT